MADAYARVTGRVGVCEGPFGRPDLDEPVALAQVRGMAVGPSIDDLLSAGASPRAAGPCACRSGGS
jgi:hypothetical protein